MRFSLAIWMLLVTASPLMAAEGEKGNLFAGSVWQSMAAIIAFVLLFLILKSKAWGPILKGLQERENKIRYDLQEAEDKATQANATLDEYQTKLKEAHAEAQKLVDQARKDAEAVRARLVSETEEEIARLKDRAQSEITQAKQAAVQALYAQTAQLATAVAGKLLKREISDNDAQSLVDESLQELDQLGNAG